MQFCRNETRALEMVNLKIEAAQKGTNGTIRLVDYIGDFTEASSSNIRSVVDSFLKKGVSNTTVYINSRGGSTMETTEIVNELKRLPNVKLTVGAVAASAATYLMTQFKNEAYPSSQFMIHPPKMMTHGDLKAIKSNIKLLENTTAEYITAYSEKMGKTPEEIEALFEKGDYWMTAQEAKDEGLLDEILPANQKLTASDVAVLEACGAPTIPKVESQTPNNEMDKNVLKSKLKLSADATDAQIESALDKAMEVNAEMDTFRAERAANLATNVEALVDKAILDKKITADTKATYVKLATANFEDTKSILEGMASVEKVSDKLKGEARGENRKEWTLDDYITKDPEAYEKMKVEDPEKAATIEANYFNQ